MDHIHYETDASPRDTFEIAVDRQANVYLLDEVNYPLYCVGKAHLSFGGPVAQGAQILKPNRKGRWHIAVDLGGAAGTVVVTVHNKATGQAVGRPQKKQLQGK